MRVASGSRRTVLAAGERLRPQKLMRMPGLRDPAMRALAYVARKYHQKLDRWFGLDTSPADLELQARTYSVDLN